MSFPPGNFTTLPPSPSTPTRARKPAQGTIIPGFRPSPRPKVRSLDEMTIPELRTIHERNLRILASPSMESTSSYIQRIAAEQAIIEARLGVENIREQLESTSINADEGMNVDADTPPPATSPPAYHPISAKQAALERWDRRMANRNYKAAAISFDEAARIERETLAADEKRRQEVLAKKRRQGLPIPGEELTRQQREAQMWAFMNYKPTESDLEDDDDEDEDDGDPATWFVDDQDDGRKGQDIVEPDEEDLTNVIRVDHTRIPYSFFPRED